jgi:hypothetical protein
MDNFLGGFHAVILGLKDSLSQVTNYPLFWGFTLGFLTSTIVHAFLMSDHPKNLPTMLFTEQSKSFEALYAKSEDGTYAKSYSEYSKMVRHIKILSLIAVSLILVLIIIVVFFR